MLEEGLHADITLIAQGGSVKAHRGVLASVSPVFRAMFQHHMKEQRTFIVDIPDMTVDALRLFLLVLYTTNEYTSIGNRAVPMPQLFSAAIDKHFSEFWEAIHKYQVVGRRLRHLLLSALVRNLTVENCWYYYDQSLLVDGQNGAFSTVCHNYILCNYKKVIALGSFLVEMRRNPERVQGFMILAMTEGARKAALESHIKARKAAGQ